MKHIHIKKYGPVYFAQIHLLYYDKTIINNEYVEVVSVD